MKKILTMMISALVVCSIGGVIAKAEVTNKEVKTVQESEIPEGIIPMTFDTDEEADQYMNQAIEEFVNSNSEPLEAYINPLLRTVSGTIDVDTYNVVGGTSKVKLKLDYRITSNLPTGKIEYVNAYTSYTGFTMPFSFEEKTKYAIITASKKDVDVKCTGVLNAYLFSSELGIIKLYSYDVTLGRTVYLIR